MVENTLVYLNDNLGTDKQYHDYLKYYDEIFKTKKYSIKKMIEVGIGEGGSLRLWDKFFKNAEEIHGFDTLKCHPQQHAQNIWNDLMKKKRIYIHNETDAYNIENVKNALGNKRFDFILDDGPHTLESQIEFIKIYTNYLSENGILIIEDIQNPEYIKTFFDSVTPNLREKCRYIDCRNGKNSNDSLLFVIEK